MLDEDHRFEDEPDWTEDADEEPDPWAALDGLLADKLPEPVAPPPTTDPDPWSILSGNSKDPDTTPEAQGRRAAKCARRVRAARDIQKAQKAMLAVEIDLRKAELAQAEHRYAQVDEWFLHRTEWDRWQLREWYETAPQFAEAGAKTVPLAFGLTLQSRTVPGSEKWEAPVDKLLGVLPPECFEAKLKKAQANKLVEVRGALAVLKDGGQIIDGATVTRTDPVTRYTLTEGSGSDPIPVADVPILGEHTQKHGVETDNQGGADDE